ncbi:MAG TPA: UDP-glucose 4-epimerase GalE [Firmicutes bacterium]|nr:UDP-glucose 4-epimerase GalE [Bacillota bacterium]
MNILVTGGAGYVGSHVVEELLKTNKHNIVVLDNLQKGHREAVLGGTFIEGDLADADLLNGIFAEYGIEAVVHLAADSLVGESVQHPDKYFRNNVTNGLKLLDAMVTHGAKYMVFSSTAAVYGEPIETPIREDHPQQPTNPYGESKLFFERIMARYDEAYGLKYMSLRYFNAAGASPSGAIGEDHRPETHLIPIILQAALGQRDSVTIFGTDYDTPDGTCIRDYIHVTDLAAAHVLALDALAAGAASNVYNLGNGAGFSVREVIDMVEKVVGRPIKRVEGDRRPGDPAVLVASSQRITAELGWQPKYHDLETIVQTAWDWHRKHPHGFGS